jgi:predicted nucleotidyltransferase
MRDIRSFLDTLREWAVNQPDIRAVALVGSFARGTARDDSDIDVVIMTETPQRYLQDATWLNTFGQANEIQDEDWGMVQSRHTFYNSGLEVEFSITTPQWAEINPIDEGTREVIADGAQIVYDPSGIVAALIQLVEQGS